MRCRPLLAIAGGLLVAVVGPTVEPSAEVLRFGDEMRADCSNVTQGDVRDSTITIICGMPYAEVVELVRLAASPEAGDRQALIARLDGLVPANSRFAVEAIARLFEILGEEPVESERLADRFAEIATELISVPKEIRGFSVRDLEVQALKDEAAAALEDSRPDHDRARAKLEEARQLVRAKQEAAAALLAAQQREEAALVRAQARVEAGRLRYAAAAMLHEEAASLLPHVAERMAELAAAARRWYDQGHEFGDNSALHRAEKLYSRVQELIPMGAPLDEAMLLNDLGLLRLALGGPREATEYLREAVHAYRWLAQDTTRERVPLQWASILHELGNALTSLGEVLLTHGEQKSGMQELEEAVKAYQLALEERTRERVPLDWATTQNNLGNALRGLGERESGTARLEGAAKAYSAALEERTRERTPLGWAMTQNNLALALQALGERKNSLPHLQAAHAAVRGAYNVVVIEAGYMQYEDYYQAKLAELEQQIATLNAKSMASDR